MIDIDYAAGQLSAVFRMALARDPANADASLGEIDSSVDGFFRSFWAIALAAPFAIVSVISVRTAARRAPEIETGPLYDSPLAIHLGVEGFGYLLDWGVSIAAIALFARAIGATKAASEAIVSYNWAQVIAHGVQAAPISVIALFGAQSLAPLLFLPVLAFVLVLFWGVFRRAMGASAGMAAAIIILLTLISLIVSSLVTALARAAI